MENVSLIIAIIALLVALWQGWLSKQQLDEAKQTKNDTEKLLDEIKDKVNYIQTISNETRSDVKDQVSKLIDKQDENMKTLLNSPAQTEQNQMIMQLMSQPDVLKQLLELTNNQ